jgi:hypothetical protein
MLFDTALVILTVVLGLEVVHYREAVLAANVDRKRAWDTVVTMRRNCEVAGFDELCAQNQRAASGRASK